MVGKSVHIYLANYTTPLDSPIMQSVLNLNTKHKFYSSKLKKFADNIQFD